MHHAEIPLMSYESNQMNVSPGDGDPRQIRVLIYHRVRRKDESSDPTGIAVSDTTFHRQMELLDRWGYISITFDDYRLFLEGKLNLPKRCVIITFDDAYEDIYIHAYPILKKFGMKAVVFVVGDLSITSNVWDENKGGKLQLLNMQQLLELHVAGFEIGSHTLSHPNLTLLTKGKAWQEIVRSRMMLEILLNAKVRSFAYPYGLLNDALKKMVADAGYDIGCGAYTGPPFFGMDYFDVRRIKVLDTSNRVKFWIQMHPMYSIYRWMYWTAKNIFTRLLNKPAIQ
jgi:peptidoglycan/xylan/chitin deacetylase (PgdA/CDA1 family)